MYDRVLSPFRIRGVELRNRVVRTAHGTNLGRGALSDELIAFHEARARGGVGLTVLEATGVHPSGPMTLNAWDDAIVPRYAELARRCHAHGMRVFSQLNHLGVEQGARGERPWSASAILSPWSGQRALAIDAAQIAALVAGYAAAARRAREGGLDGVEIHCAHGHLLQQFLSARSNRRDDDYGGDEPRRRRLLLEVLRASRAAVGADFVLGIRVGPQLVPGGLDVEAVIALVRALEREALTDYVSISQGGLENPHRTIAAMHEPAGYELECSAPIAAATGLPTIVTGRLRTLADAEAVLARGVADLVGLTRAHIADPELVAKSAAGRAAEVRPCIGCNQGCVGGLARGRLACSVNARVGCEAVSLARATVARSVLVVGGGPAGLEAARIATLRGHRVVLAERGPALGGTLAIARRAPRHADIGEIADWLVREVARLAVDVRLGTAATPALARDVGADVVLVACGAEPSPADLSNMPVLDGAHASGGDGARVCTARELLCLPRLPDVARAVVVDELGTYEAIGAAERLIDARVAVTWVTPLHAFAPKLAAALVAQPALERLRRGAFELCVRARVLRADAEGCELEWLEGGAPWRVPATLIVVARPGLPADALTAAFRAAGCATHALGDARHPGTLQDAIRDGHDVAAAI